MGRDIRYFSKLNVAELKIEAHPLSVGDRILITGPTTGALEMTVGELRYDLKPIETAKQGWRVSLPVDRKIRPSDKVYLLTEVNS